MNIIQINGIKGILFLIGAGICLVAGFVVFPGLVLKFGWNYLSAMTGLIPSIGLIQGVLLWGIVIVSYFTFKKKGFFVEFRSANCLTKAEMDEVMHKIRMDQNASIISKSIMRANRLEQELKKEIENNIDKNIEKDNTEIK
ncbi:hypothetical protein J6O48_12420 [bacterium]|nr:hypothetical protein [bacterium]